MKKQIVYTKFIPRLFATTLDLFFLSILLTPVMHVLSRRIFLTRFQQYFIDNNIDTSSNELLAEATRTPEFANYISNSGGVISYFVILYLIHFVLMGIYFVGFWRAFGATPGKMIMRMKIVDAEDYNRAPSTYNLVKRFVAYLTAIIGIWSILFSKKGQSMHDKIAGTVVIKN